MPPTSHEENHLAGSSIKFTRLCIAAVKPEATGFIRIRVPQGRARCGPKSGKAHPQGALHGIKNTPLVLFIIIFCSWQVPDWYPSDIID
jgi:hypothetical protein